MRALDFYGRDLESRAFKTSSDFARETMLSEAAQIRDSYAKAEEEYLNFFS